MGAAGSYGRLISPGVDSVPLTEGKGHKHWLSKYNPDDLGKRIKDFVERSDEFKADDPAIEMKIKLLCGQPIFIPRRVTSTSPTCIDLQFDRMTTKYSTEFDVYPGASVVTALGQDEWLRRLAMWTGNAALELVDFGTDVALGVSLFSEDLYLDNVPFWLRAAFVSVGSVSLFTELLLAWWAVKSKPPQYRAINGCYEWLRDFLSQMLCHYLAIPTALKNAPNDLPGVLVVDGTPMQVTLCQNDLLYQGVTGFVVKLPKFVLEDTVMLCLSLIMQFHFLTGWDELTVQAAASICISTVSCARSLYKLYDYVKVVRLYGKELQSHVDNSDDPFVCSGRLKTMKEQPMRRFIMDWC